ncbi:MAG: enoyl-CoA hydratase/isomerase family protein [Shewanellaceae bacterium]|nr:enoyl-CoA hydratase/isomerase family protein [Shewanellaceae bacterium]
MTLTTIPNYQTLVLARTPNTATITFNRPECHNAMNATMISELRHALAYLANQTLNLVVLNANGKHFSAGADLNWMQQQQGMNHTENCLDAQQLADLMTDLDQLPHPTLAQVQGAAYGGALGLIACCDLALCHPDAVFCFSEVKLGLIPAVISPYVVRTLGLRQARAWMLTADRFDAQQAQQMGLIHNITDDLAATTSVYAEQLATNCTEAMTQVKSLLRDITVPITAAIKEKTIQAIAQIRVTPEAQARMLAFLSTTNSKESS